MKLFNPSDAELNAAFAEKVCGWKPIGSDGLWWTEPPDHDKDDPTWPTFCSDANAVLPWLEKWHTEAGKLLAIDCWVILVRKSATEKQYWRSTGRSFAKTSAVALLRAHGVEIEGDD